MPAVYYIGSNQWCNLDSTTSNNILCLILDTSLVRLPESNGDDAVFCKVLIEDQTCLIHPGWLNNNDARVL